MMTRTIRFAAFLAAALAPALAAAQKPPVDVPVPMGRPLPAPEVQAAMEQAREACAVWRSVPLNTLPPMTESADPLTPLSLACDTVQEPIQVALTLFGFGVATGIFTVVMLAISFFVLRRLYRTVRDVARHYRTALAHEGKL